MRPNRAGSVTTPGVVEHARRLASERVSGPEATKMPLFAGLVAVPSF
jgi:hypothetical protein